MTTNYSYNNKKKQKNNQQKPALDQTNPSIIPEELLSTDKIEECSSIAQNLDLTETDTRELQDIMSMILSRITEMGSKVSTSMIENNPICQTASKEHIKVSLEETIRPMMHQSVDFIHSIKKDIKEKCEKSIRKLIEKEKGHDYTTVHYLKTVRDFQRYYDYITPYEIKGKEEMEFIDALNNIYDYFTNKKIISQSQSLNQSQSIQHKAVINEELECLFNALKGNNTKSTFKTIQMKLTGLIKKLNKDEIIIELADIVPYLNEESVSKAIKKMLIISKLFYEMILRQYPSIENIDLFCNVYYAKKDKDLIIPEYENNVSFNFINFP